MRTPDQAQDELDVGVALVGRVEANDHGRLGDDDGADVVRGRNVADFDAVDELEDVHCAKGLADDDEHVAHCEAAFEAGGVRGVQVFVGDDRGERVGGCDEEDDLADRRDHVVDHRVLLLWLEFGVALAVDADCEGCEGIVAEGPEEDAAYAEGEAVVGEEGGDDLVRGPEVLEGRAGMMHLGGWFGGRDELGGVVSRY